MSLKVCTCTHKKLICNKFFRQICLQPQTAQWRASGPPNAQPVMPTPMWASSQLVFSEK